MNLSDTDTYNPKMTVTEYVFDPENKIDTRYGIYTVLASIVGFGILNIVVSALGKPRQVKGDPWLWNNLIISWIHGFISGGWDILCLYLYPEMLDDLIHHINYCTYLLVAFSTGYFVYDFLDLLFRGRLLKNWEVSAHHVAVVSMFYYDVHCKMCIGYNVLALMAEINSFFLHSRKLLMMLNYDFRDTFYRAVCMINLVTFATCRGWSLGKILYGMATEGHMVPRVYFLCLSASIFIMSGINPVLFWRLFKNDVLRNFRGQSGTGSSRSSPVSKGEEENKAHLNGNNNQVVQNHIKSS